MKGKLSILGLVLILAALIFSGCAPVTGTPSPPEASPEVLAARDVALVYVIGHYGEQAPWRNFIWLEQDTTGEGLVGHVAYEYAAGDWVITISYPVVAPEAVVYSVVVANEATGFQWEGEVDAQGMVTELGAETPQFFDRVAARDAAMNCIYEHYHYPPIDEQAVEWEEEDITPEGLVGSATFRYTAESWVVEVSYPIVAPEATIYQVTVTNDHLGFEWQGTVDAQGVVTEGAERPDAELVYGEASVESIEILILESFPVQVNVVAKGYLSDACTEMDEITQERQGNTFAVTITTVRPADAVCAQVVTEFEEVISLDVLGLPAGTYRVDVNGVTDSFELEMDNVAPEE